MPTNGAQRSRWFEPQTLVGILGLAMVAYGGFQTFQSDVSARVGALEVKVAVLEANAAQIDRRVDRVGTWVEAADRRREDRR